MKKLFLASLLVMLIQSCGINKQTRQIKALEECDYEIIAADSIFIAGTDVSQMVQDRTIDISRIPGLALGLFRKNIPLEAKLRLQIRNPTAEVAAINQFEYILLIKNEEIANGSVNEKVSVAPGGSEDVFVKLNSNVYRFFSNGRTLQEIADFIQGSAIGAPEKTGLVTLKIRPTIQVGNKLVKYPGYITIDKEVSSKILF
jgi:hypothetical protein